MPKPSFGCLACRQRRVKCDERNGGCRRCERYGIPCPGYQHPLDVVLRNKGTSDPVSRNFWHLYSETQGTGASSHNQEQDYTNVCVKPQTAIPTGPPPLVRQPSVDPEQAALGAYYTSYCVSSSTLCSLEHIRQQGNGCLLAAIKMLGKMQLHQIWQLPGGSDALVRQYTEATTLLNTALASPTESQEDSTLLATLILSIVEMKTSPDFTLHYWLVHTQGAAALVELRGADQVLTRLGSALFLQISSQIVVYCLLGRRYVPDELQHLRNKVQRYVIDENHPLWQWHGLMYRCANLIAESNAVKPAQTTRDAQAVIAKALSIYDEIKTVFQSAGTYWKYNTQASDEHSPLIAYEHVYQSRLVARVWNERRTAEILIFATIVQIAARYDGHIQLDKKPSRYVSDSYERIKHAALETLAAVPQLITSLKDKSSVHASPGSEQDRLCDSSSEYEENVFQQMRQERTTLPYMDSCRVQWPIYFAVQCEYVESPIRRALLHVLEDAGETMYANQGTRCTWQARGVLLD